MSILLGNSMKKPKILLMPDVPQWAWGIKSRYLQKYLSDEFDVQIQYLELNSRIKDEYDIYLTYTPVHLRYIQNIDRNRKLTGITGHLALRKHIGQKNFNDVCAGLHVNSRILTRALDGRHERIYYTPNGVDCTLFKYQEPTRNPNIVVGYLGKPMPEKGLRRFIIPAIRKVPGVELRTFTKSWKDADPIITIPEFYRTIDLYLVASTIDGTPNPALEAAATGRPLISNSIGNMPEFIIDGVNGFQISLAIPEYVEKLKYFRYNKQAVKRMGWEARKTAETAWSWEIQAENYRKMFKETLDL